MFSLGKWTFLSHTCVSHKFYFWRPDGDSNVVLPFFAGTGLGCVCFMQSGSTMGIRWCGRWRKVHSLFDFLTSFINLSDENFRNQSLHAVLALKSAENLATFRQTAVFEVFRLRDEHGNCGRQCVTGCSRRPWGMKCYRQCLCSVQIVRHLVRVWMVCLVI